MRWPYLTIKENYDFWLRRSSTYPFFRVFSEAPLNFVPLGTCSDKKICTDDSHAPFTHYREACVCLHDVLFFSGHIVRQFSFSATHGCTQQSSCQNNAAKNFHCAFSKKIIIWIMLTPPQPTLRPIRNAHSYSRPRRRLRSRPSSPPADGAACTLCQRPRIRPV